MHDEISRAIERAYESIEVLDKIAADLDADAPRPNRDVKAAEPAKHLRRGSATSDVDGAIDVAVEAIMGILTTTQPSLEPRLRKRPPKWWHYAVEALRDDAQEGTSSARVLRTLMVFQAHLHADVSPDLVAFVLLASDDHRELRIERLPTIFRSISQPNPQRTVIAYDPQVDDHIRRAFHEAGREVLTFPQPCDMILRAALDEVSALVE